MVSGAFFYMNISSWTLILCCFFFSVSQQRWWWRRNSFNIKRNRKCHVIHSLEERIPRKKGRFPFFFFCVWNHFEMERKIMQKVQSCVKIFDVKAFSLRIKSSCLAWSKSSCLAWSRQVKAIYQEERNGFRKHLFSRWEKGKCFLISITVFIWFALFACQMFYMLFILFFYKMFWIINQVMFQFSNSSFLLPLFPPLNSSKENILPFWREYKSATINPLLFLLEDGNGE